MRKWLIVATAVACAVAAAASAEGGLIKGSITATLVMPQMELPRADAWAKDIDNPEKRIGHEGELGDISPGFGYGLGLGISVGDYFRIDAAVATMRTESAVTYTGQDYTRDLTLTTHVVPVRIGGTFLTPTLWDRVTPEVGLGLITFISKYDTYQELTIPDEISRGTAWAREVCYGPEIKGGAEVALLDNLTLEAYISYFTAEATLINWRQYDFAQRGPGGEDYTGWAIWFGPRFYWP